MRLADFEKMTRAAAAVLMAAPFAACQGPDTTINRLLPEIGVAPESIDFGEVVVLYDSAELIQIINAGRAPLEVDSITVEGEGAATYSVDPPTIEIQSGESAPVEVTFTPATYLDYNAELVVHSNDEDTPEVRLPLHGTGVDGPTPDIDVDPLSIDFGTVAQGEGKTLYFTLSNVGDGPLEIGTTVQEGSGAFTIVPDPDSATLSGGAATAVVVTYTPTADTGDNGSFTIPSNDPDEPSIEVLFLGNGGGDFDYPVADIDCPLSVDPPISLDLDGTGSYDPNGYELTYKWDLADAPSGSTTEIDDAEAAYTSVFVDLAGFYTVNLVVTNELGISSAPAKCKFTALPEDSLHVELTWDDGDSDLDLHLVDTDGSFFEQPGDCCWCNRNPSWGESGSDDDPNLKLDNRLGYGPENIKIPYPADGEYEIFVHYFDDMGAGSVTATVKIWIDGVLEDEVSLPLKHNDMWDVGYVRWPDAVFIEGDETNLSASVRDCY